MISSIVSVNNTKHIALYNYDNSMCYHISVIQRLHSSPTLNKLCQSLDLNEKNLDKNNINQVLMLPIKIYSEIDKGGNDSDIYTRIKEYFNWFVPNYVSNRGRHGYAPNILFIYFLLPVINKYFPNDFKTIIEELHISKINFNNIDYVCNDTILNEENTFLRDEEDRKEILEQYREMINNLPKKYDRGRFVSAILEIYPNKDKTGGHAITLIRGKNTNDELNNFYIIDDQNSISKLADYYNFRKEKLYEISIRDIDEITMANINAILRAKCNIDPSCKFSKRVSRFALNFEHNFLSISEDILKNGLEYVNPMKNQTNESLKDEQIRKRMNQLDESRNEVKFNTNSSSLFELFTIFLVGLIIGLIIGLITSNIYHSSTPIPLNRA